MNELKVETALLSGYLSHNISNVPCTYRFAGDFIAMVYTSAISISSNRVEIYATDWSTASLTCIACIYVGKYVS